jgi:DNA-binding response OmpR family regulator
LARSSGSAPRTAHRVRVLLQGRLGIVARQVHDAHRVPSRLQGRASRAGQVVTRHEGLDVIWGTDFVAESNIVDRHIRSLRVKLQNDYRHPRFIATVPGKGYRFIPTFSDAGWDGAPASPETRAH